MKNGQRQSFDPLIKIPQSYKTYSFLSRGTTTMFSQKYQLFSNHRKAGNYDHSDNQRNHKNIFSNLINLRKLNQKLITIPGTAIPVYVCKGNNSELIKKILSKRKNVIIVQQNDEPKFRWYPTSGTFRFERLTNGTLLFNHYEYHKQITNKQLLTRNLSYYCQRKKLNLFEIIPPTFILNLSDLNFQFNNMKYVAFYNAYKPDRILSIQSNNKGNGNKTSLNIKRNIPSKMPVSNTKSINYKPHDCLFTSDSYLWLLKPTSLNRGRGIHVFQNLTQVQDLINEYYVGKTLIDQKTSVIRDKIKSHSFIIQKYIQKPLLIKNRKFDLRVWVLLDHEQNIYFYKEGYARTSSQKYTLAQNGLKNQYIHLTNNAIQKKGKNYGKNQSGNQISFSYLTEYMKEVYGKFNEFAKIINKMKELIRIVFESIEKKINCNNRKYCYELFGFDFMVDESAKVWLIQINTNPCLEQSSQLLQKLIPQMLNDTFRLTFDKIYNVEQNNELNQINGWQKISKLH